MLACHITWHKRLSITLADRTSEALEAIEEAEKVGERTEERQWSAELHRLRGVFLTAMVPDEMANRGFVLRSHQNRKGAEVGLAGEARGRKLC